LSYNEVLTQVQRLALSDQLRLLEELRKIIHQGVEVEGDDEVVSAQEIAESQAALADYFAGRDRGISSKELKLKLRQPVIPQPKRSILELSGLGNLE
jgi:acetylglutamate kinase